MLAASSIMRWKIVAYHPERQTYTDDYAPAWTEDLGTYTSYRQALSTKRQLTSKSSVVIAQVLNIDTKTADSYLLCQFSIEEV